MVRITLLTQVKKERKERETSVRASNPAPSVRLADSPMITGST